MLGEPVIEWGHSRGRPTTVGDGTITPVSRSLMVRWPGGAAVWSGPAAVIVEREGKADRIPVTDLTGRIIWATRVGAVALVAAWLATDRRRRNFHD